LLAYQHRFGGRFRGKNQIVDWLNEQLAARRIVGDDEVQFGSGHRGVISEDGKIRRKASDNNWNALTKGKISETELQIVQIDRDLSSEVGKALREIDGKIGEFLERKVTAEDQLMRVDIRAPQDGTVHQSTVHTIGGVIPANGEAIMLIVPAADNLIVEAKVAPQDIDQLRWTGADGNYNVVVRADGVPLAWRIGDGDMRTPGAAVVTLKRGDLIRLERTDRTATTPLTGRDAMWSVVVMPGQ